MLQHPHFPRPCLVCMLSIVCQDANHCLTSSCSVCAGAGCDGVPEQHPGGPWPSSRPALLLHHQRCPQQPQHHLDGDTAVQCQPARTGTGSITLGTEHPFGFLQQRSDAALKECGQILSLETSRQGSATQFSLCYGRPAVIIVIYVSVNQQETVNRQSCSTLFSPMSRAKTGCRRSFCPV